MQAGLVERERLFELLDRGASAPVTVVTAPAGSGKTTLLTSWLERDEPPGAVAWVGVERDERDATRFWAAVLSALRHCGAVAADDPLATLAPAPLGGEAEFVERLLEGLSRLTRPVLLIVDDVHELHSEDAVQALERLLARAPARLHTFLLSRRDPKLGLHRLRLSGDLVEVHAEELGFTPEEAGELMAAAGLTVQAPDVARLHARTEGWAAGLRLAALSLARHDAPERFVAEFSGSERTVADYLLEEVLARQPDEVRVLLLRTCILDTVCGPLADALTGRSDGTRRLHELAGANAFVVPVDVAREWFRYHHLLADLLRLELEREAPGAVPALHRTAAAWLAANGYYVEAIRHAALGDDLDLAVDLLGAHWAHLILDGEEHTLGALLALLPAHLVGADAEVAAIAAADLLAESRWEEADARIEAAARTIGDVPAGRRGRAQAALAAVQLLRARRIGDVAGVLEDASAALAGGEADAELEAFALMNLGIAETWTLRLAEAEEHLEAALGLARRAGRRFVAVGCQGALGVVAQMTGRLDLAEDQLRSAVATADRAGWPGNPVTAAACVTLAAVRLERGALDDARHWLDRAGPALADAAEPAAAVGLHHGHGMLATCEGRFEEALAAFTEGERLAETLRAAHFLAPVERHWRLRSSLRLGDLEPARAELAEPSPAALWCSLAGHVRLADGDPEAAAAAVAPVLAGEAFVFHVFHEVEALLLDAGARTQLGEPDAAERSVERALALLEPQGRVLIVLTTPGARELLETHPLHRTAHAGHLKTLLGHLAGAAPEPDALREPLTDRELAVLRFLPTNLSANDIGRELYLSVNTVKTHMRRLYAKLDVHTRAEAVERGRALGLLARHGG